MTKVVQIASRYDNMLVALAADGSLFEETRGDWQAIPGPEGERITAIAVRHTGGIVAVTAGGQVYEQYRTGQTAGNFEQAWRPLLSLPQES